MIFIAEKFGSVPVHMYNQGGPNKGVKNTTIPSPITFRLRRNIRFTGKGIIVFYTPVSFKPPVEVLDIYFENGAIRNPLLG